MVVVGGEREAREAQWGKLSGRGDAISAAEEGRGTGKPEEGPGRPVRRPGEHGQGGTGSSFPRVCRTKSKQDGAQAGVAGAALLKEKRRRRGRVASASPRFSAVSRL